MCEMRCDVDECERVARRRRRAETKQEMVIKGPGSRVTSISSHREGEGVLVAQEKGKVLEEDSTDNTSSRSTREEQRNCMSANYGARRKHATLRLEQVWLAEEEAPAFASAKLARCLPGASLRSHGAVGDVEPGHRLASLLSPLPAHFSYDCLIAS